MTADLFISYAWTSDQHREWVRLLAANLKAIGYDVLVDADVDYGDSLTGFMQRATDSRHVLLVVDENYVYRADHLPDSGVGIENGWFKTAYEDKPPTWLSVVFKDNPGFSLPAWLAPEMPKGHPFVADPTNGRFPGSEQVEELWRWMEDLPANRDHATSIATLRARSVRLETIDRERDPASWADPATEGEVDFAYERSPGRTYRLGCGEFEFAFFISGCGAQSVYVLKDYIHAVGLNLSGATQHEELASQLTPGRSVVAHVGQQIILQNQQGALCLVDLLAVQREVTQPDYIPASVRFRYRILTDS
ncbi:toll/interleukin-1 receptor domain-containing protein [Kocuria sp.]|uniref:toll/interleukin-1 receptor domain-containing protein n=1 Tax=Kocuria sp. TaxID=1871328 RepID=UPI0026DFFC5D|nr:toll/interleukin-1 receptor domain-containing protein [Kocuria sp.]MDO5619650.1 toll/interleukin-1 receptor domain-containing protein [Kocuria sp.]